MIAQAMVFLGRIPSNFYGIRVVLAERWREGGRKGDSDVEVALESLWSLI